MRRWMAVVLLALLGFYTVEPAFAARRQVGGKGRHHRTVVVVHRGWPLRRALRPVVVRPVRVPVRVTPAVFLPVVVWGGVVVVTSPAADVLAWEDAETIRRDEDWTEFTLNADSRGTRLWLQMVAGRAQFDWAEVVFDNGDTRVVDMNESVRGPGHYELLDFRDGRRLDHVRIVARAKSDEARIALKMEK